MKFCAVPVVVDAFEIVSVGSPLPQGAIIVATNDGMNRYADPPMTARMDPKEGDYWVIQQDGYEYLNPKAVFERKYTLVKDDEIVTGSDGLLYGSPDVSRIPA